MAKRAKEDAEKTRERILTTANKLFEKQGYSATSVAQICDLCDITKGALFHHFSNKESLFKEIWTKLQLEMDQASRQAAIAARSTTDHYAAFLAGIKTYLDWACRKDYQQIVLIDGPAVLGMAGWYEADDILGRENTMSGMRWLARHGLIEEDLLEPFAIMFHNALNGAGFAISRGGTGITPENTLKAFETMLRSMGDKAQA